MLQTKVCCACGKSKPSASYSKNQRAKKELRRCHDCVASNAAPLNPDLAEEQLFKIPQGQTVLCSPGLKNLFQEDPQTGEISLNIDKALGRPRDFCGSCQKPSSKLICTRCKRIAYCSKECQKVDWKRHKLAECESRKRVKRQVIEVDSAKRVESVTLAQNKIGDSVDTFIEEVESKRASGKIEAWDQLGDAPPDSASEDLQSFICRYYEHFAAFAAVHIDKYPRLKGSLFLFTKVSVYDLCNVPIAGCNLDRVFALVWGCRHDASAGGNHPAFSARYLADKFLDDVKTLPAHMESCCDTTSFSLVICSDPSGRFLPDSFGPDMPLPAGVDPIHYVEQTPTFTSVARLRFFDFSACLEMGRLLPVVQVNVLNMDRNYDEPTISF